MVDGFFGKRGLSMLTLIILVFFVFGCYDPHICRTDAECGESNQFVKHVCDPGNENANENGCVTIYPPPDNCEEFDTFCPPGASYFKTCIDGKWGNPEDCPEGEACQIIPCMPNKPCGVNNACTPTSPV